MAGTPSCELPCDDQAAQIVETMARAAEQLIIEAVSYSAKGAVDKVERCVGRIGALVQLKGFPSEIGGELISLSHRIRRDAHEKQVSDLFDAAMMTAREGTANERKEALARISAALVKAVKNGADARFCENVAKRLEILTLTTQEGIDDAARRVAGRKTTLKKEPQAFAREHRRAIRYVDPILVLDCRGWGVFRTVNWSCWGFLARGGGEELPPVGKYLKFTVQCGLLPGFEERIAGTVIRNTQHGNFVVEMPSMTLGILRLMTLLKRNGIVPEPE
jgi:hypothetical protein